MMWFNLWLMQIWSKSDKLNNASIDKADVGPLILHDHQRTIRNESEDGVLSVVFGPLLNFIDRSITHVGSLFNDSTNTISDADVLLLRDLLNSYAVD